MSDPGDPQGETAAERRGLIRVMHVGVRDAGGSVGAPPFEVALVCEPPSDASSYVQAA